MRDTYNGGEELKHREEQSTILRRARLLDVKLRESHEVTVGQTDQEAAGVEGTNGCGGHHDNIRDGTEQTGEPEAVPTAELGSGDAGETGADEGAEGHEGGDELLSGGLDVPAIWNLRVFVAEDLEGKKIPRQYGFN